MRNTRRWSLHVTLLLATLAVAAPRRAAADLSASYDGTLSVPKLHASAPVAGALAQASVGVIGTLAMTFADATLSGVYNVNGTVKGSKVTLAGANSSGVRITWAGRMSGDSVKGVARLKGAGKKAKGTLLISKRVPEPPSQPHASCDNSFFTGQVMGRVLEPVCAACHTPSGAAAQANFKVTVGDPIATQQSVDAQIDVNDPLNSRILKKPLGEVPHGGGTQLSTNDDKYPILLDWVQRVAKNQQCAAGPQAKMVALKPAELLVRASMDLRGIRPSLAELDALEADPNQYGAIVDQYLHSDQFLDRVKDIYDDALLVRREDFRDESRDKTSTLYSEALELIAYIVKNDRPLTEMGTASYTVANQMFQSDTNRMPFPMEPVTGPDWQPTHYLDNRPHAGLISTSAFYQVWDTNNTNKNRRRANRLSIVFHCYNFLDTPVDVTRNVDNSDPNAVLNAITTRSDCMACHKTLDPMASFLFPMDNAMLDGGPDNNFRGGTSPTSFFSGNPERWRVANRRAPAVNGLPGTDIRDMGRLLTQDPKFAACQTKRAFKMMFLRDPQSNDELAAATDFATKWATDDNYNFRALVKRWVTSDVYKNHPENDGADWVRRTNPERLEAVVKDLTGFVWSRAPQDDESDTDPTSDPPRMTPVPLLTNEENGFKIILGGVNGVNVSARSYSLNASVAMVQRKLAALAADSVVQSDLALADGQRVLLNGVAGTENPASDEASIRAAIVRIARRFYGYRYAPDAPEVTVWFNLYRNLYGDPSQGGTGQNQVPGTQGERAWRGLLTAMLRSPLLLLY